MDVASSHELPTMLTMLTLETLLVSTEAYMPVGIYASVDVHVSLHG